MNEMSYSSAFSDRILQLALPSSPIFKDTPPFDGMKNKQRFKSNVDIIYVNVPGENAITTQIGAI